MTPGAKKKTINLHDVMMYVAIGRKHLRLMTLLMCLTMSAALFYYVYARPVYYSRSYVRVDQLNLPMDTEKIYRDGRLAIVKKELKQPHILERTARRLGIKADSRELRKKYLFKIVINTTSEQNLEIEVWPYSKEWAQKWTETMVAEYLDFRREKRIEEKEETIKSYTREMQEVGEKLEEHLGDKFDFREKKDVTKAMIDLNQIRSVPLDLARLNKKLDEIGRVRVNMQDPNLTTLDKLSLLSSLDRSIKLEVGSMMSSPAQFIQPDTSSTNTAGTDKTNDTEKPGAGSGLVVIPPMIQPAAQPWEELERQQRSLVAAISDASLKYLPGHKVMVKLQNDLALVNHKLDEELHSALNRFDVQYQDMLDQKNSLEGKLPEYSNIKRKSENLAEAEALHDAGQLAWKSMFRKMATRVEALDFAGEKERIDLTYMGLQQYIDRPVSPNRLKLTVFAIVFGGLLAIGIPFLIEYLDHTTSNLEQVESTFQLRGLGIVPKLEGQLTTPTLMDPDESKRSSLIENFRVIRTNLLSMGALSKAPRVMMITSAMPKEGKTVVSSNLAISFAQMGERTLLIDTDLRRGRMHRLFGYRKSPGLSDVLMDDATLDEAIRPTTHENLSVVSAGKHLESGTELLGSQKFTDLMATLRERFDRVVVDTPPVLGLSETSIMQRHVDGVLLVIWSGHTPIRNMKVAIEMLQGNGANFYGFVLNRLDLNATTNYYQYYYYSYDYYYSHALENA